MSRVPKRVRMPWRPIVGLGEGRVVCTGPGDFWEVTGAGTEVVRGARHLFLDLSPLNTADGLTGFGEFIEIPPVDIEEV